jgi:hypothetical protein
MHGCRHLIFAHLASLMYPDGHQIYHNASDYLGKTAFEYVVDVKRGCRAARRPTLHAAQM